MARLLAALAAAATAGALQIPDPQQQLVGAKTVAALDPELTNTKGEVFHVTVAQTWNLIKLPKDATTPETAELSVDAKFEDLGTGACDDLLIREITVKGTKLGTNISSLTFGVLTDVFNNTNTLGLTVGVPGGADTAYDPPTFVQKVPACTVTRPRAAIALPTKNSFRKRTKTYTTVCALDGGANVLTMTWSTVWFGLDKTTMTPIYKNDLEVFVSGVGDDPAGLLGPDDHSAATLAVVGCPKKQPVAR